MDRLMTGQPLRTTGALTIVGLAHEADVKRHVLTTGTPTSKTSSTPGPAARTMSPLKRQLLTRRWTHCAGG